MILLVATLLVAASGYAESKDSLKVENVMSVENPERVTITESDNRLMVEIDGKKDNPSFRYVREVEISPSDVSVTKERSGNWDFNIPFRKRAPEQRHKRNEFVVKDFKIGLSTVQGAPDNMDVSMAHRGKLQLQHSVGLIIPGIRKPLFPSDWHAAGAITG